MVKYLEILIKRVHLHFHLLDTLATSIHVSASTAATCPAMLFLNKKYSRYEPTPRASQAYINLEGWMVSHSIIMADTSRFSDEIAKRTSVYARCKKIAQHNII